MPTDVLMPKLADTLVEGTVTRWLKAANETVQTGEPIAEIETDKVTTELTAPTSGTLSELLVAAGETVPIGTPLARIRIQNEQEPSPGSYGTAVSEHDEAQLVPEGQVKQETAPKRASPLAVRIAQAYGIDLGQINAPGSRITRADVEQHLLPPSQPLPTAPLLKGQVKQEQPGASKDTHMLMPNTPLLPGKVLPLTGLRRATAARMATVRQVPTGTAVVEADVTALEHFYRKERDPWLAREGFPLTYTPFFLFALAQSLRAWPAVRQSWRNGQAEPRDAVHVAVAVALEDGLIVPVIHDADQHAMPALARIQSDLVTRARSRRLQPGEVTGGVATLTNVGSMAGLLAFPMLNEHQAIILGVGTVTRRAVAASDGIHYRSCVYLSLTFDRRLLDDLQAERFLLDITHRISQPSWLEKKPESD